MNKYRYIFFSMIFMLICASMSYSRAEAMSHYVVVDASEDLSSYLVVTPYPTLTPIGATATSFDYFAEQDFTCPAGIPEGYGVITPSIDWYYACGHCLPTNTPIPFYTSTLGPTHTPVITTSTPECDGDCSTLTPTVTPTTTATPTVTPMSSCPVFTPTPEGTPPVPYQADYVACDFAGSSSAVICEEDTSNYARMSFSGNNVPTIAFKLFPSGYPHSVTYRIDYTKYEVGVYPSNSIKDYLSIVADGLGTVFSYGSYWCSSETGTSVTCHREVMDYLNNVYVHPANNRLRFDFGQAADWPVSNSSSVTVELWSYAVCPDDTSTSTPSPSLGYCHVVSNTNVPNLFEFGGTGNIVFQECAVIPSVDLRAVASFLVGAFFSDIVIDLIDDIFGSEFVSLGTDPLTVCVRSRDYSLYLFGVRMPVEFLLGLGIVLSFIRYVVPSITGAGAIGTLKDTGSSTVDTDGNNS